MFKPILLILCLAAPAVARPWSDDVMYFMMTDRFHDGDPENNSPAGCDPALYDPHQKDISRYMGGDLRGVEKAIQSGYFNDLGVTALWLTPVVKNVWRSGYDLGSWKTGYHGYWTQDWLDTSWAGSAVSVPSERVRVEVRSRDNNGQNKGTAGTTAHPHWHAQPLTDGFKVWDTRAFGFGAPK